MRGAILEERLGSIFILPQESHLSCLPLRLDSPALTSRLGIFGDVGPSCVLLLTLQCLLKVFDVLGREFLRIFLAGRILLHHLLDIALTVLRGNGGGFLHCVGLLSICDLLSDDSSHSFLLVVALLLSSIVMLVLVALFE